MNRCLFVVAVALSALSICSSLCYASDNPAHYLKTEEQKASAASIEKLGDKGLYKMEYSADYRLDEVLKSGSRTSDDLLKFLLAELLGVENSQAALPSFGCSAFAVRTKSSDRIFGRNFDYNQFDAGVEGNAAVLMRVRPKEGYSSVGMVPGAFAGFGTDSLCDGETDISNTALFPFLIMDGMNEAGLAVSVLWLDEFPTSQDESGKYDITTTVALRLMLDRAATVEEAAKLLGDYNMWSAFPRASFHFLVADKTGAAKVLEYDNDNVLHVFDANYVTNFYLNEDVQALITTPSHHDHGLDRYNKIEARLKAASNVLSENEAMALLKDVSQKPGETGTSNTRWSVVYNLSSLTAKVAAAQDYDNIFSFRLKGDGGGSSGCNNGFFALFLLPALFIPALWRRKH